MNDNGTVYSTQAHAKFAVSNRLLKSAGTKILWGEAKGVGILPVGMLPRWDPSPYQGMPSGMPQSSIIYDRLQLRTRKGRECVRRPFSHSRDRGNQFFELQPARKSRISSPALNSGRGRAPLFLPILRWISSMSFRDHPTLETSISPSCPIQKMLGTLVNWYAFETGYVAISSSSTGKVTPYSSMKSRVSRRLSCEMPTRVTLLFPLAWKTRSRKGAVYWQTGHEILKNAATTAPLARASFNENFLPSVVFKVKSGAAVPVFNASIVRPPKRLLSHFIR